ncbi:hypothetical protein BH23CHL8_BH23CHL8_26350 [soil metagenome]
MTAATACARHRWIDNPAEDRKECRECGRPKLNETLFREQIVGSKKHGKEVRGLADQLGWEHVGWRPAMTKVGWRTPGTGTLAKGWPDLVLVHPRRRRLLFVELKGDDGKLSDDQVRVLHILRALEGDRLEVHVWGPDDIGLAAEVLTR